VFIEHLNRDIALHVVDKDPKTIMEAITQAQQVEDNLTQYGDRKKDKGKGKERATVPVASPGNLFLPAPQPDWMHLDALNLKGQGKGNGKGRGKPKPGQGQGQKQRLNPQQLQYLKQTGACFKCYNQGHTAKFCPLNRTVPVASIAPTMQPIYQSYPAM